MTDDAVRAYAREKHFAAATRERWLRQPAPDRNALLELARQLRLGENQFRDVLDYLEDIAAREGCGLAAVLASPAVRGVLERDRGRNEAIKALKDALRRLRYPQLAAAEEKLVALVKRLHLSAGVRVEFPQNLEGEEVTVTVRARSAAELRARAAAIAVALQAPEVDEIFRVLAGER